MAIPFKPPEEKHIKTAIALVYDPKLDNAPKVIASGRGEIADKILQIAQASQIPIREDPILAQALSMIDLEKEIPAELYAVVAEVLGWVYRLRNKTIED
ncbi:MAG TPA: EscU/YscU/HrcU family type III secretion system export apparatus switch protein [Leptolinea sp.]